MESGEESLLKPLPLAVRMAPRQRVLVTGASGCIGGRLLKELEAHGRCIRCLARQPQFLRPRVTETTEIFQSDVLEP